MTYNPKVLEFRISAMGRSQMINDYWLRPASAARRDPDAFLRLADEVAKVAKKVRAQRAQQRMDL